jgi:GT2 family glycosyltransferase
VRTLLDSSAGEGTMELIVVDQSPGNDTEQAVRPWLADARFRYHRAKTVGKGAGLNEGLGLARGRVVVLTDDDCAAPRDWVVDMARVLESQPTAAILFCNVVPVPHDPEAGYVPAHQRTDTRLLRSVEGVRNGLGLGAGMAIRLDVARTLGGFDESFGPGARFPSADEWDICIRALLSGWHVYETPELSIVHDGFRSFAEGKAHAKRDWVALGAVCAKPLRAGHLRAAVVPLVFFPAKALWPPLQDVLHLRKPRGLARIVGFLSGFAEGLGTKVDPKTMRFLKPG